MISPDIAGSIQRAYEHQRRARELCRDAADVQLRVLASQRWAIDQNAEGRR